MNGYQEQLKLEFVQNVNQPIGIENRGKVKLCECGCGSPAPIATQTDKRDYKKGEPKKQVK